MADSMAIPAQCGMILLYDLYIGDDLQDQVNELNRFLFDYDYSQVIITDRVDRRNRWKETKRFCHKGPITVNPNSGNKIRVYIATRYTLSKLKALLKKKNKKKTSRRKSTKKTK